MKQYFTYDDAPIDLPPQNNFKGSSPNPAPGLQNLFTEPLGTEDTVLVDGILPNNSRNTTPDHFEDLEKVSHLPDFTESKRQQWKIKDVHNTDNPLDINTLPNCLTNHGKRRVPHLVEKKIPANDHTLSDCVINRGKQRVARSRESNNSANNLDQQKTRNEDISIDTRQTLSNDSNIYLVE